MIVTAIEPHNSKQVKIFLDGEFSFVLYKGELSRYRIKSGEEMPAESYRLLTEEVLPKRVKLRAMNLLTKRPYTEEGLRRKLREGLYPEWLQDVALTYVKSFGYIDDTAYARDYADSLSGRYSLKMIRRKMKEKGIREEVIESCLSGMEEELSGAEDELLHSLIAKKTAGKGIPEDAPSRAKLMRFLAGKGFDFEAIRKALGGAFLIFF